MGDIVIILLKTSSIAEISIGDYSRN